MRSHALHQSVRAFVEISPDSFVPHERLALEPGHITGAAGLLRSRLRDLLGGLSPIMGEDTLLTICREVVEEDRPR